MLPFYGRRRTRKLKNFDLKELENFEFFFNPKNFKILNTLILAKKKINLEVGFGSGDNLVHQANIKKNEIFIGCEPFLNGVIKLKKQICNLKTKNIYFTDMTFNELLKFIEQIKFRKIFILFPDPWPKKRHLKRRLINLSFVKSLLKITSPGSEIIVGTDHKNYLNVILYCFFLQKNFILSLDYFNNSLLDKYKIKRTKYYQKAEKNKKKSYFLLFRCK